MYYLTLDGYDYTSSDGEGFVQDDDGPSTMLNVVVRAAALEGGLAALGSALARAPADAERRGDSAKLTFCTSFLCSPSGIVLQNRRSSFGRFVDLLQQPTLPGHNAAIRTFKVSSLRTTEYYSREEDMERLFRDVLPNHPTIERIRLGPCERLSRFARLLVASVPSTRATPLLDLTLQPSIREDPKCFVDAVCDMLRRDVPLRAMSVRFTLDGDPADCRPIFRSLAANTHLQGLALRVETVTDDTLCLASDAAPALRALHVEGRFTPGGVESVARQLTTNTTLVELRLRVSGSSEFEALVRAMERVLATHNFTIRSLRLEPPDHAQAWPNELATIAACLRRNERIRQALEQLPTFRVIPAGQLPLMMEMVSDLPTLIFRFLRRSDINELFEDLLHVEARKKGGGGGANKRILTA